MRCIELFALGATAVHCRPILGIETTELDPSACTFVPQRIYFADKPTADARVVVAMVTEAELTALAADVDVPLDPTRGHVLTEIRDCENEPAAARLEVAPSDPGATPFVTQGETLGRGDTSGVEGVTGVFNTLVPTELELTALPEELSVESSQGDVVMQAGELARITLSPNSEVDVSPPDVDEWRCVGTISEPTTTEANLTLDVDVQRARGLLPSGLSVAGLRVVVCRDDAAGCAPDGPARAEDEAFTDASGRALVRVDIDEGGFDGHLVVSGSNPDCAAE
ncbi:MAG: hypothetical protein AAF715_21285 [Myxococcota bacterium]